jgi:hypothetical protein
MESYLTAYFEKTGILSDPKGPLFRTVGRRTKQLTLKNGGTLEKAASMANHASTRTTQLYDRRSDEVTLDEVERVGI